jgi:hypothetical protein
MTQSLAWDQVTHAHVVSAIREYGGKTGAVKVLGQLGFTVQPIR